MLLVFFDFLNSVSIRSMRLTCQGKSAPLSSSQRFKGLMQLWNLRIWTQTWRVSPGCGIISVIYDLKFKAVTLRCSSQILLLRRIAASTLCILVVSEVAMESSPGPSTSSGCRSESDHRPQSCPSNTPRAGMCCSYSFSSSGYSYYRHLCDLWLHRYAVYPSEGSSVEVNAKFPKESHPGSSVLRWYPTW